MALNEQSSADADASPSIPLTSNDENAADANSTLKQSSTEQNPNIGSPAHNVVAVFTARFDVILGNTIEWQYPETIDLSGVEYQAICSGQHRVESDTVYFAKPPYFGVSVFQKVVANERERGANMRSMGVIVKPTPESGPSAGVWLHGQSLKAIVSRWELNRLYSSENYPREILEDYLERYRLKHKVPRIAVQTEEQGIDLVSLSSKRLEKFKYGFDEDFSLESLAAVEIIHTLEALSHQDSFPVFVAHLGPQVFTLWKAALLRKRILYLTSPPMERACSYVYNTFMLGAIPYSSAFKSINKFLIKYSICVNDIVDLVGVADGFVACTPDTIFESKTDLYDLLIHMPPNTKQDHSTWAMPRFQSSCPELAARYNAADFVRFRSAIRQIFDHAHKQGYEHDKDDQVKALLDKKGDCKDAIDMAFLQMTLWWHKSVPRNNATSSSSNSTSWQSLFGGQAFNQRKRILLRDVPMDDEEQQELLLGSRRSIDVAEEEQDAQEIQNNDILNIASHPSAEEQDRQKISDQKSRTLSVDDKLTAALMGYFHALSYQVLTGLDRMLSMNDAGDSDVVTIHSQDLLPLGLHPQADADFVAGLATTYFGKHIRIIGTCDRPCLYSSCCMSSTEGNGSIRI